MFNNGNVFKKDVVNSICFIYSSLHFKTFSAYRLPNNFANRTEISSDLGHIELQRKKIGNTFDDAILWLSALCIFLCFLYDYLFIFFFFQITKIGYVIHKTTGNNFQVLAGSASFLFASYCLGKSVYPCTIQTQYEGP